MIPFLTYPLALIALASLPALAAIYILRNRFRRRQVSSLMLWQFRVQSKEGGVRINRIQLPLVFFLELLALALLVIAATGPHWQLAQARRPLIVVLDDSFSMRAGSGEDSARARAQEALAKLFGFQAPPSTRIILAGSEPRLLGATLREWAEVKSVLDQWQCRAPTAVLEPAISLATELGHNQANILVLTDQPAPGGKTQNPRLRWHSVGNPASNLAIVNAARTANGEEDRCLLEIANFSREARQTRLTIQSGSNTVQQSPLNLGPREQQRVVFSLPKDAALWEATLESDALFEDNRVQLLPPVRQRVRVRVALTNEAWSELVDRALAATGMRAAISDPAELVIHHESRAAGTNAWNLQIASVADVVAYTGPFIIDTSHPLMEGISLEGVVWAASPTFTNAPEEIPLILAGNVPLVLVREDLAGRRFVRFNLNPELSTIQRTPDWPALFWNLLAWRATERPGLHVSNARLGSDVVVRTDGSAVRVQGPDGTWREYSQTADQLALECPEPGLYAVTIGGLTNRLAVNCLAPEESDLQSCAAGEWGKWERTGEGGRETSSLAWIFALGAAGLLVGHLGLLATGRGGA